MEFGSKRNSPSLKTSRIIPCLSTITFDLSVVNVRRKQFLFWSEVTVNLPNRFQCGKGAENTYGDLGKVNELTGVWPCGI